MATIKSTLALEDKMTPTLSKAEKQAILNVKAYDELDKQMKWLEKTMQDLERQGKSDSDMYYKLSDAWDRTRDSMKQYADGTLNAKEGTDKVKMSLTELNQGLELVQKGLSLVKSGMNKMNEAIDASKNQFNAEYTAATKMHNMMGIDKKDIDSLYEYAAGLQDIGIIGDEAIISGMGILSTSASNTESLKQLAKVSADAAVGINGLNTSQTTYETMTGYVQKALEGSAQMLYRNQVLTKKQADYVDSLNDTTEKENALISMLSENFGEANEVLAQTAQGGMMQADNKMGDLNETIGEKLLPIATALKEFIVDVAIPVIDWIVEHLNILLPILGALAAALLLASAAQWALNIAQYANPIGIIILAVVALIAVILILWENCAAFRDWFTENWANVVTTMLKGHNTILAMYNGAIDSLDNLSNACYVAFSGMIDMFADTAIKMITSGQGIIDMFNSLLSTYNQMAAAFGGQQIQISTENIVSRIESIRAGAKGALHKWDFSSKKAEYISGDIINDMADSVRKASDFTISGYIKDKMTETNQVMNDSFGEVKDIGKDMEDIIDPTGGGGGGGGAMRTTTNDDLLSDEDIQLLLDIATRDYKLTYQQVTPNITLTFGDIRETADVDDILDQVADRLEEIYDSNLEVANG